MQKPGKKQEFLELKDLLGQLADGISGHFGSNCEVVVHDLTDGVENTIAIIKNGHVTGRKQGDDASETVLEALQDAGIKDRYGYHINSKSGRLLKSSTINIHGKDGDIIAIFCINFDISDLAMASNALAEFTAVSQSGSSVEAESIPNNVNELLEQLIEESRSLSGKPVALMSKEEKKEAIHFLNRKGALLVRGSSERIAEYYGISKYSLYNYLGEEETSTE